jgi:papain like protease
VTLPKIPNATKARAKAIVGAVISGIVLYLYAAWQANQDWTLHGLEGAILTAVVVGGFVHQTANAARLKRAKKVKGHTVTHRRIDEIAVPGRPLGRHVRHDSRSLAYQVVPDGTVATVRWDRTIPVLDQGQVGSCTGNAAAGALGTTPCYPVLPSSVKSLNETFALALYSAAETIDGDGPYPPNDNGSSGLSVAKACKNAGLISGYTHITSIAAAQTAIQTGPFIVGSDWYTGMDNPNESGLVTATGTVRGGHEYECIGYNAEADLWELVNSWGTSYGVGGHFFYSTATFKKLLAAQGDATVLLPLAAPTPAPTPTPTPGPDPADVTLAPDLKRLIGLKSCPVYIVAPAKAWLADKGLDA